MLPSLLAKAIQDSLKQFLVTDYEPSDAFLHGLMRRFVADEQQWLKGPYVQIGLPFAAGARGTGFFEGFKTPYPAYSHQERAWERLCSDRKALSTLVATGTGSGKTECFLYPLLDHCARAKQAGEEGIKALVIYPMNALATDQARRIAQLVVKDIAKFTGLRVGLYVGGQAQAGSGQVMSENGVITDRETLRKNPPDILLTNYKMLDYLMLRPRDRRLWAKNSPTTLRYIVVDELHTFDGAQGTDLALLLRRLRARLAIPDGRLICVGTSATLGDATDTSALRDYARQIFGTGFDTDSVVTENRQTVGQFLEDSTVDYMFAFRPELSAQLDPARFRTPEEAVRAWFALYFPEEPDSADVRADAWRAALGQLLKRHQLFQNLLKLTRSSTAGGATSGAPSYAELATAFGRSMPSADAATITQVLDALLVLVAWARRDARTPLVTVRLQLWVRELRRMVGRLSVHPDDVKLVSERDLPADRDGVYLPMVQCSQCRTTGWISRLPAAGRRLSTNLDEIYNTWFAHRPEAARIYAADSAPKSHVDGERERVCVACGTLHPDTAESCSACGHQELLSIFRVTALRTTERGGARFALHDTTCPACGEQNELLLLGARNATLGAQVVEGSWASAFNDDKKLIAFSDSVQDAAHRAGFFGARTYLNNVRTALARVIDKFDQPVMRWSDFLARLEGAFSAKDSLLNMTPEAFVAEFIAPNMTWQRDWAEGLLGEAKKLPDGSRLPGRVRKRLLWQAFAELTYQSHRGRTLERAGKAVLAAPWSAVTAVAERLLPVLHEEFDRRDLNVTDVAWWLWGTLTHLRRRGGVMHPELVDYASDGNVFQFTHTAGRGEWLPRMGNTTPRPVFLTQGTQRGFDRLQDSGRRTWYERWAEAVLGRDDPLMRGIAAALYASALEALRDAGLLTQTQGSAGDSWALNPDALELHTEVACLATSGGKRRLMVPARDVEALVGMPCLDAPDATYDLRLPEATNWWARRFSRGDLRRVIAAEHTGLLDRQVREALEARFKAKDKDSKPWYENLLSATPTLEMGVDIGDMSSVLLCSVPPSQASFLQRIGRAGRRDGNAMTTTLADGNSPHDLYFFAATDEMLSGAVEPPGVFLRATEVLRRQLAAYCIDDWVAGLTNDSALPDKTATALDAIEQPRLDRFPYILRDHIMQHEQRLFEGFVRLLGNDIDEAGRKHLLDFMQGQGDVGGGAVTGDGLNMRLIKALEELNKERQNYKKRREGLDRDLRKLREAPQDPATADRIGELQRERDKLLELIKEINGRDLLNTLTDAGLIPNYAFPEAGMELKSVLWRKRTADDPGSAPYVTSAFTYERPARSALSEFAPENRFYANQRRVEVDQINMDLAKVENWRLCPSCHHMQNLELDKSTHAACPRCGDDMWADAAQRRTLLRFKQAIANSNDTEVRIDDSADDREPRYYVRQLLSEFDPEHIVSAWQASAGEVPFGFEFISRVTFREVNFGELAKPGDAFRVASREAARPGFKICKHCGKVQTAPRLGDPPDIQRHGIDCAKHGSTDPENLLNCLYLYREFESEALRMLVPFTRSGMDERVVQSFMAALQLGLKKRFGGKVDHLQTTLVDEPGKDGGPNKHYVMLYDTVPGGTGYLQQLLAHDAGTLGDVVRLALESIRGCDCAKDPTKDGCYRCVYQYRQGRSMQLVSRSLAEAILGEVEGALSQMVPVATISDIYVNPNFDSVLEKRFLESLPRMSGMDDLPPIKLIQDVVHGKSGFVLDVGGQRYKIEPQCVLGPEHGVAVSSKPDFVIWPWSSATRRRPIAVFCDGWSFHKDRLRDDALKRSAIVASERFWTWSVTHDDVAAALQGAPDTDLESPLVSMARHDGGLAPPNVPRAARDAFGQHAVTALLRWLAAPADARAEDAHLAQLQCNALWHGFLMVPNTQPELEVAQRELTVWRNRLPAQAMQSNASFAPVISRQGRLCLQFGCWPLSIAKHGFAVAPAWSAPGVVVLDELAADSDEALRQAWRQWLQVFNTAQTLPGMVLATGTGLDSGDYAALENDARSDTAAAPARRDPAASAAWDAVIHQALEALRAGLTQLARAGTDIPEVGLELADAQGRVACDCELAWHAQKLVVLRDDQQDFQDVWRAAGWRCAVLDAARARIQDQDWPLAIADALGVSLA